MPRGYRRVLLAAFGWLALVGADQPPISSQKRASTPVEQQRGPGTKQATETTAGAIRETLQPAEKDRGCQNGKKDRNSDLCAQWTAADAASDASQYALWSLLVSGVGTGLLIWTLWETRANARRELRAYISVKMEETNLTEVKDVGFRFDQNGLAHNGGSTPAYDCVNYAHLLVASHEVAALQLAKPLPISSVALNGGSVIHSGEDLPVEFRRNRMIPLDQIDSILNGKSNLYMYGVSSYRDAFGVRRRTDYCFMLSSESFRDIYVNRLKKSGERYLVKWTIADFHNSAT